jgi:multiple sugar transport system substrate-binding protein
LPTERAFAALVYYRKDLFEKYGIPTPKTFSDLEEAAKIIYERSNGEIYGIVNRGAGAKATSQFRHALHEFGGKWNDLETGRPTINTPEAIAAFEWWGRTLRLYGPPGVLSYDWQEAMTEFLQGKAAISLEGGLNAGRIEDPEQSKVVGKAGYLPMVSGPGGPKVREYPPVSKVEALAISPYSETKEAAWYFVQWMTGKEAQAEYITTGRPAARESAWKSEQFLENTNRDWAAAFAEASKYSYATPSYAPTSIRDQAQARDIIGAVIVAAINGEDVKAAADKAEAQLIDLWEKEKAASD